MPDKYISQTLITHLINSEITQLKQTKNGPTTEAQISILSKLKGLIQKELTK